MSFDSVLDAIAAAFDAFVVFPHQAARDAAVLWAAHTWVTAAFDTSPRLSVLSGIERSGKTTVMTLLRCVCRNGLLIVDLKPAPMLRQIHKEPTTFLLDEIRFAQGPGSWGGGIVDLLDAGYKRGPESVTSSGRIDTFAPVAFAGIGSMDGLPKQLLDRSLVINLQRRMPNEIVEPLRLVQLPPVVRAARNLLIIWSEDAVERLVDAEPAVPEGLDDRSAELWSPLLAIADDVGGSWPERARSAANELQAERLLAAPNGLVKLVADCIALIEQAVAGGGSERITTDDLLGFLNDMPLWNEKPFTSKSLAENLASLGIRSRNVRVAGKQLKGYRLQEFKSAWCRLSDGRENDSHRQHLPPRAYFSRMWQVEDDPQNTTGTDGTA